MDFLSKKIEMWMIISVYLEKLTAGVVFNLIQFFLIDLTFSVYVFFVEFIKNKR